MIDPNSINWNELGFAYKPTRSMYIARCKADETWKKGDLVPFGDIPMSPAACVLNYGQGLFEGLKAYRCKDGSIQLFRPTENAKRIAMGCERLCIPPLTEEVFMDGIMKVANDNKDFVPPYREDSLSQGSLYFRPLVWGTSPLLGVKSASEFTFVVFCCPVGPYFKNGFKPIKLKIVSGYHRAAPGCTGGVKAIGNYAGGMLPAKQAKEEGFSEILYLDAKDKKYLEEVGAANFFCIRGNSILTPELDGAILPGITRKSILHIAADRFGMKVEERKVSLEEALTADEAFASGTAAVISPIGAIYYDGKDYVLGDGTPGKRTVELYKALTSIQHGLEQDPYGWIVRL
jgi:branched-chain amino acid aminotransferase